MSAKFFKILQEIVYKPQNQIKKTVFINTHKYTNRQNTFSLNNNTF